MSTASQSSPPSDIVRDVVYWKRKKLSIVVLLVATATWVLMEVYQFNFITLASWAVMFVVTSAFLWGNILRLFNKEPPNMSGLEITEQTAVVMAHSFRSWMAEAVRWLFRVGAEGDWFVFVGTVAALWVAAKVGSFFDLLTPVYIGIVGGMIVPVVYTRYEDKMKGYGERLRMQCKRFYSTVDDKVFRKIKNKFDSGESKVKKIE